MHKRELGFFGGSEVRMSVGVTVPTTLGLLLFCYLTSTAWAWEAKRAEALNRPREVIYNNDGDEPLIWSTNQTFSIAGFLDMRTTPVLESQVDTVFYSPTRGFAFLTANIPSADLMLRNLNVVSTPYFNDKTNVMQSFLDLGTDPLREVVSWCRTNNLEVFASLRVNDTHDAGTDQTKVGPPYDQRNWLFPPFKIQHPEMLMGSYTNRTPYCNWSAVDFTHETVRERLFQMCRDLCTHYDVDGLDLDFYRHMQLFKSVAWGGTASDGERAMMTELMRRIRVAAETEGKRRGRPILISVRVPDSVPYCWDVGIDLEAWLREGLLDLVMTSGYWRHNPWQYTAELCRRYNVKSYASFDESRLGRWGTKLAPALKRGTRETYRARAMAARQAGLDGIMYFNMFSPERIKDFMEGNLERMRLDDKSYFVSYRGHQSHAGRYVKGGERHFVLPELSVRAPAQIEPGKDSEFPIWIGDDIEALSQVDIRPRCELLLDVAIPEGAVLSITVNGHTVVGGEPVDDRVRRYPLRLEDLVCGENLLRFSVAEGEGLKVVTLKDAGIFLTEFSNTKQ